MKRIVSACLIAIVAGAVTSRAEIAAQSAESLQAGATHIVVGTVKFIGTHEEKDAKWLKTSGVVEVQVDAIEKGKRIEPGDAVYARFWQQGWIGKGNPPPSGSGHRLPKKGDRVRVFLQQKEGGYDALLPNGFEVSPEASKP